MIKQATENAKLQELTVDALIKQQRLQAKEMNFDGQQQGGKGFSKEVTKFNQGSRGWTTPTTITPMQSVMFCIEYSLEDLEEIKRIRRRIQAAKIN